MVKRRVAGLGALVLLAGLVAWWWMAREREMSLGTVDGALPPGAASVLTAPGANPSAETVAGADELPEVQLGTPDSIAPASGSPASSVRNTLSGRVVGARGEPLAGHVVRLTEPSGAAGAHVEATTDAEGCFTLTDRRRGVKLLQLFGSGQGDIAVLERDKKAPDGIGVGFRTEEGKILFAMPPDGLAGVVIVGPRHASFWVRGRLERPESGANSRQLYLSPGAVAMCAAPPDWGDDFDRRDAAMHASDPTGQDATRIELAGPNYERDLDRTYLVGADQRSDRVLVVSVGGYATEVRTMQGEQLIEDAGTIALVRVAGLTIDVRDAVTSDLLEDGTIELRESGGGLPDRVSRHVAWNYINEDMPVPMGATIWSERSAGRYELRISFPGYAEWIGSGDLVLVEPDAEPPRITAELQRPR